MHFSNINRVSLCLSLIFADCLHSTIIQLNILECLAVKIDFVGLGSYSVMDPLIEFLINLILFVIFLVTFVSQFLLLYRNFNLFTNERLSAPILNNITYWCIVSFTGFIQSGYKCVYAVNNRNSKFLTFM